jgi:hypothetical protein
MYHTQLKELAHRLTGNVRRRNEARADWRTVADDLAAYLSWHGDFHNADAKTRMRWNAILLLHVIAWICDAILVMTFSAFLARLFSGGNMLLMIGLTVVLTLVLSAIGVALILGTRLLIDEHRRARNIPSLRRWEFAGGLVSAIPLLLVVGVGFSLAANHHLGSIVVAIAQLHLIWVALAAVLATAILIFSGDLGITAKGYMLYKKEYKTKCAALATQKEAYRIADGGAVHSAMHLVEGTKSFLQSSGQPPILPPFDDDVVVFMKERFSHTLPTWSPDDGAGSEGDVQ